MYKTLFIAGLSLVGSLVGPTAFALDDGDRAVIIRSVQDGDYSVLDDLDFVRCRKGDECEAYEDINREVDAKDRARQRRIDQADGAEKRELIRRKRICSDTPWDCKDGW